MTRSLLHLPVSKETLTDPDKFAMLAKRVVAAGAGVHLDFGEFVLKGAQRFHPLPLYILSNVFLAARSAAPAEVTLPKGDTARLAVMRSGLLFGLLNRRSGIEASKVHIPGVGEAGVAAWVDMWSHPWSPREPAVGRLFDDEPRLVDSKDFAGPNGIIINPRNAKHATRVVVDPHRRSRNLLQSRSRQGLAKRWLRLVTPWSRDLDLLQHRETWMSVVADRVLVEPLVNLSDHAIKCPEGAQQRSNIRSLVLLARTDGGQRSFPRLQMIVADNGYGLVSTLVPKLRRSADPEERSVADGTAAEVLRFAVDRPARTARDPGLPWARTGFQVAFDEAHYATGKVGRADREIDLADAEFSIITGDPARNNCAIWVQSSRLENTTMGEILDVPFSGTTVFATIPMPRTRTSDEVATPTPVTQPVLVTEGTRR